MQHIPLKSLLGRALATEAIAKLSKRLPGEVIDERYPNDPRVQMALDLVTRSATSIADTVDAAAMIPMLIAAYTAQLAQVSAFGGLRTLSAAFNADDGGGAVKVPMRAKLFSDVGSVAWVGQGGVLPVSQALIGAAALQPLKAGGVVAASRELLDLTAGLAEETLLAILAEDVGQLLDRTLTDDAAAVEGVRPAGLLFGVTPSPSIDGFGHDLPVLIAAAAAGAWRVPALILSPARLQSLWGHSDYALQLQNGRLGPFALLTTPFMADPETLIALDASAFSSLLAEPEVVASENASLTLANADGTPPTQAIKVDGTVDVPGRVNQGGGIMVSGGAVGAGTANIVAASMLQQYAVALRHITRCDWALGRPDAVAAISGAGW